MFHGVHDEFKWLETPAHVIQDILQVCPAVVTHKHIAVTSFDPKKLHPVEEQWLRECRVAGSALYLPVVRDPEALPANVFDEWYIFPSPAPEKTLKRFLNYEWFTLGPAQVVYFRHNITWDVKRMRRLFCCAARPEFAGQIARQKAVRTIYSDSINPWPTFFTGSTVRVQDTPPAPKKLFL